MTDLCLKREFQTGHSRAGLQHRDIDANDLPGLHKIDGRGDLCRSSPSGACHPVFESLAAAASSNAPFSSPCHPSSSARTT